MSIFRYVAAGSLVAAGTLVGVGWQTASAGCTVNVEIHNVDSEDAQVDWSDSQVKIRYGTWRTLGSSTRTVEAGEEIVEDFNLTFGCGTDRQYRFQFIEDGAVWTDYFPSDSTFTDNQTIHVHIDR